MDPTYLNHLKAKYSDNRDSLFIEVGRTTQLIGRPVDEAIRAARLIYEASKSGGKTICLCMSGGIDSEAMARSFLLAGVPFVVSILRFKDGLNQHDILDAEEFCLRNGIEFNFVDLDVLDFFETGKFLEIAKKYRCRSPQFTVHIEFLRQVKGIPILAWNPTSIQWVNYPGESIRLALPGELHLSYHRYFESAQREGVGFFFAYTPELFYSFFQTPTMNRMLHQLGDQRGLVTTYESKCLAYQEGGFDVQRRVDKFTGFEKLKVHYGERFPNHRSPFDFLFRTPLELLYPDPLNHYAKVSGRHLIPLDSRGTPKT